MRGFAGILSPQSYHDPLALCETMRSALGSRAAFSRTFVQTSAICVASGSVRDEQFRKGSLQHSDDWIAVSDARLDNGIALAAQLGCKNENDELLLHAYRRWGNDCVHHIQGEFAFVVWDPQKECLFLARDPFGVRPIYYSLTDSGFAFASQANALLELPDFVKASSKSRIAEFLRGSIPPVDQSSFLGISRLPAGFRAVVRNNRIKVKSYWSWTLPELFKGSEQEMSDRLAFLFRQAVERRVPDVDPVAVTLSGGLDSSAVAVTVAGLPRFQAELVPTYSIVFDSRPSLSERKFIECLLSVGGFKPHFYSAETEDPFLNFDRRLIDHAGLFLAPNIATGSKLLEGLQPGTVLLSGHGGDEVISHGYERFHDLAQAGHWLRFYRECFGANEGRALAALRVLLSYYVGYSHRHPQLRRLIIQLLSKWGSDSRFAVDGLLSDEFREEATQPEAVQLDTSSCGRQRHLASLADPEQQYALEFLDRDGGIAGREVRFPFWDRDLIEFMLSVPADQKLRGGFNRSLMRRAMRGSLPEKVRLRRGKHDFSHHLALGLMSSEASSKTRFDRDAKILAQYLNLPYVQEVQCRISESPSEQTSVDPQLLWRATAVAEWLQYADRDGIQIVE